MPFKELNRRESWPPAIVHLQPQDDITMDAMDDNPFSFFLTSPDDVEDEIFDDDDDLSAGIETPAERPSVREVSPSSLQRVASPRHDEDGNEDDDIDESYIRGITRALSMPLSLEDFTSLHSSYQDKVLSRSHPHSGHRSRPVQQPSRPLIHEPQSQRIPSTPTLRGRVGLNPAVQSRGRGRGRGQTRSVPARRPRSWREPSPDVWSIPEEREDATDAEMADISLLNLNEQVNMAKRSVHRGAADVSAPKKIVKKVRFASLP
ncbi:MAG: hypothetical protein M1818_003682 [Claussenomyces sp. TS43310]|nr:MAG: hypothetical protein M1818_003682 [Claussenomyces sp. TS43310]